MIIINDDTIKQTGLDEHEVLLDFAAWMHEKNFFTVSQAASFCNLNYVEMMKLLGDKQISIIDESATMAELEAISKKFICDNSK